MQGFPSFLIERNHIFTIMQYIVVVVKDSMKVRGKSYTMLLGRLFESYYLRSFL